MSLQCYLLNGEVGIMPGFCRWGWMSAPAALMEKGRSNVNWRKWINKGSRWGQKIFVRRLLTATTALNKKGGLIVSADDKGDARRRRKAAMQKAKWPIVGKQQQRWGRRGGGVGEGWEGWELKELMLGACLDAGFTLFGIGFVTGFTVNPAKPQKRTLKSHAELNPPLPPFCHKSHVY